MAENRIPGAIRCCLCRMVDPAMEPTDLPGTGYRCADHEACARRVRGIVEVHVGLSWEARSMRDYAGGAW